MFKGFIIHTSPYIRIFFPDPLCLLKYHQYLEKSQVTKHQHPNSTQDSYLANSRPSYHIEAMDEHSVYGSRKAVCPLSGESYYQRASNMLSTETPRPKQVVTKTWTTATKALYVIYINPSNITHMLIDHSVTGPRRTITLFLC